MVSALLIQLCLPPLNYSFLIWVALLPWIWELHHLLNLPLSFSQRLKQLGIQSLWLSYLQGIGSTYWLFGAIQEFGGLSPLLSLLFLQLGALTILEPQYWVTALILGVCSRFYPHQSKILTNQVFFLPLLYPLVEEVVPKLFYVPIGALLVHTKAVKQCAEWGGLPCLTFLILLFSSCLFWFCQQRSWLTSSLKNIRIPLSLGLGILILGLAPLLGIWRLHTVHTQLQEQSSQTLPATIIQANIGDIEKLAAEGGIHEAAHRTLDRFTTLSEKALRLSPKPQLLIWPETAYPTTLKQTRSALGRELKQKLAFFLQTHSTATLFGGYDHVGQKDFNALYLWDPRHTLEKTPAYWKYQLLPFAEYIPLLGKFHWITRLFPQIAHFGEGPGPQVFSVSLSPHQAVTLGPTICYESLSPAHSLSLVRQGAQALVTITNDSWFGPWGAPWLHLWAGSFRSIETRLPMIRAANTGISALILPDGSISARTSLNEEAFLQVDVPLTRVRGFSFFLDFHLWEIISLLALIGLAKKGKNSIRSMV